MKLSVIKALWLTGVLGTTLSIAQESHPLVKLPQPQFANSAPIMQALRARKSTREFSKEKLPAQVLSDLLWAAFGVNRPDTAGRTAPSTHNWQDIDIYVATADGLFLFDAKNHGLKTILTQDVRAQTGTQDFVGDAPVNLIYVSDFARMDATTSNEDKTIVAAIDTGFIGENVYLYCAATGLATVVRGSLDKEALARTMKLGSTQRIVAAQSVGLPKK